jgi:hypothetical protein
MSTLLLPDTAHVAALSDEQVLAGQQQIAEIRRRVDAVAAVFAGELARRSVPELGKDGLARREGLRTPVKLVSFLTGVSTAEAGDLVRVGEVLGGESPWLAAVGDAVAAGNLSVAAASAIRTGLGEPTADVAADDLQDAAARLARDGKFLPPEKMAQEARFARDQLDVEHVQDREALLRARRGWWMRRLPDGLTKTTIISAPEDSAFLGDLRDRLVGPRTRGVRFVNDAEEARAEQIRADERTTEQLAVDGLMVILQAGAEADDGTILGSRKPSVRVKTTYADLKADAGFAEIEGETAVVSISTAKRVICNTGIVPVVFDPTGHLIDVAQDQRLHSARQRVGFSIRDGGCLIPWCDRPPSWCEIHHADPWSEGGKSTVANGVTICRAHHGWVHDTHRKITLGDDGIYYLIEPNGVASTPLPSKSKLAHAVNH